MNTDGERRDDANEASDLLNGESPSKERFLLVSQFLAIVGIVSGTYYFYVLLPAFENDPDLNWTTRSTQIAITATAVSENVANVVIGPAADYVPASFLLALNGVLLMGCILLQVMSDRAWQLMFALILSLFVKGLMWPSVCSLTGQNVAQSRQDLVFLVFAMGSRFAEFLADILVGGLMNSPFHLEWRQATCILLFGIAIILTTAWMLCPRKLAENARLEDHEKTDPKVCSWPIVDKLYRLVGSGDAWLVFFAIVASGNTWILGTYAPVLLVDLYGLSAGTAAQYTSFIPLGMTSGLILAVGASAGFDDAKSRGVHVIQAIIGALAMGVLACQPYLKHDFVWVPLFLAGFGAVVPSYLPSLRFSAGSHATERAFRLGFLWSTASLIGAILSYGFGSLRGMGLPITSVGSIMYGSTSVGLFLSAICMAYLS